MRKKLQKVKHDLPGNSNKRPNHFYNDSLSTGLQTTGNDGGQRKKFRGGEPNRGGKRGGRGGRGGRGSNSNYGYRNDQVQNGFYEVRHHYVDEPSHFNNQQTEPFNKFRGTNEQMNKDIPPVPSSLIDIKVATPSPCRSNEHSVPTDKNPTIIKSEKVTPPSSDNDTSSKKDDPKYPEKSITKEKGKLILTIQLVRTKVQPTQTAEPTNAVKEKEAPVAPVKNPSTSKKDSSSSSSSSTSSSEDSSEEEIPKMPKPIQTAESVKPKKDKAVEDEVVCLGKQINFEDLAADDDDNNDKKTCLVCNTQGHSPVKCQMKCTKCSQSSYETQVVCKNCGETYPKSKTPPKPVTPNPFIMFMQFMQFCMQQYSDFSTDMFQPVPGPPLVQNSAQGVEVTRQDIANTKRKRKIKSESKHSHKKRKAESVSESDSDSDSDSSSKANTSLIKKRKKQETVQSNKSSQPIQQQALPSFQGFMPGHVPFPGGFNAPGYNPMLAFTQMMGYNPATMNFPR